MWVNNTLIVFGVANTVQNRAKVDGPPARGRFWGVGVSRFMYLATQSARDSPPFALRGSWLMVHKRGSWSAAL